jgi:hypothetical protein
MIVDSGRTRSSAEILDLAHWPPNYSSCILNVFSSIFLHVLYSVLSGRVSSHGKHLHHEATQSLTFTSSQCLSYRIHLVQSLRDLTRRSKYLGKTPRPPSERNPESDMMTRIKWNTIMLRQYLLNSIHPMLKSLCL